MKFFSKNKDVDDLYLNDEDFVIGEQNQAPENPNVLTVAEVLQKKSHKPVNQKSTGALDSLKKRMLNANDDDNDKKTEAIKEVFTPKPEIKKPEPVKPAEEKTPPDSTSHTVFPKKQSEPQPQTSDKSLLEKCRPYILDEQGKDTSRNIKPDYKLESVADILRKEKQDEVSDFNQKYDFESDYLGRYVERKLEEEEKRRETELQKSAEFPKAEEPDDDATFTFTKIKNAQTNVSFTISDIDPIKTQIPEAEPEISNSTITFTPITSGEDLPKIMVSSKTAQIDLTGEMAVMEDISSNSPTRVELEKSEFDEFVPPYEIKSDIDAKRFLRNFSLKKRNFFLISTISAFLTFLLIIMKMPFMSGVVLSQTKPTMIICTAVLGAITCLNYDMFLSLRGIFKKRSDADVPAALSAVFVLIYAIMGILKGEIVTDLCLLCGISLTFRAIGMFQKYSYLLSNLKQISVTSPKKAVTLLNDQTVTFAMAKNSIQGDTLIASPKLSNRIDDYMKFSTYEAFLNGKASIITVASLLLSVIAFFATYKYSDTLFYAFYAAAVIQCFTSLPSIFLIDNLPLYSAAKRLNRGGAMIAGKAGAENIELANAVVLNSDDLFPTGTVTLHDMKVLSPNDMAETILHAAALTKALQSPLYPVFMGIAGDESILPESDTVKYEERMGISGWVDNRLLFIGNRTIMEAHGITVPDIETDHKILRSGYFPIYVANEDTAVALLSVKYSVNPTVSKELRRLTQIGVTILVNNTDPNLSNEMICDYLGLYDDSVMVMTTAGSNMYKNISNNTDRISAAAAYRGRHISLVKIINTASRIRRSNTLLTVMYIISAVLGILMFAYSSVTSANTIISGFTVLLYGIVSSIFTLLLYLTLKP